jgi:hypothetical protein
MKPTRRELIREFRVFLGACREADRRWKATLLEDRQFDGLIEVNGRLHAYELMARFLDAAERRDSRPEVRATGPLPGPAAHKQICS